MKNNHILFTLITTALFGVFAVAVLLYVSLSVPIGPWIDLTLALCGLGLLYVAAACKLRPDYRDAILLAVAAASMGGIIASAIAWSIPTLYFLDRLRFFIWTTRVSDFIGGIFLLVFAAGSLGLVIARYSKSIWGRNSSYSFPIAQLVVRTIDAFHDFYQLLQLIGGALLAVFFHIFQLLKNGIPHTVTLAHQRPLGWWCVPRITLNVDMAPMYWSIGFIAGKILAIPFAVGILLKVLFLEPCYRIWFLKSVAEANFITAFCTGLVLQGVIHAFWALFCSIKKMNSASTGAGELFRRGRIAVGNIFSLENVAYIIEAIGVLSICALFLSRIVSLSALGIVYVIVGTGLSAYQVILLMGRVGLAPLGRFATFVMVPGLLLFGYNSVQATMVAAFVEIAGGVAASASSGMRVAVLGLGDGGEKRLYWYQWIALIISALVAGIFLLFLVNHFGLGAAPLLAQRAQSRALLVNAHEMHVGVALLGAVVGFIIHLIGVNTTLLLGGILMSVNESLLIVLAGLSSCLIPKPERFEPFWSGIFAASSLWLMLRVIWG